MKKICFFNFAFLILLSACTPKQPSVYRGLPKEYTLAYEEIYGHCYDSVP
jgi:hypothetical protein